LPAVRLKSAPYS